MFRVIIVILGLKLITVRGRLNAVITMDIVNRILVVVVMYTVTLHVTIRLITKAVIIVSKVIMVTIVHHHIQIIHTMNQ